MKAKHFYCQTWKMNFYLCIGWTPKKFETYMRKQFDYEWAGDRKDGTTLRCDADQGTIMVLWTRDKKNIGALAHEAVHAANWTLEMRGWKPDLSNDEPQTYLVESIVRHACA